EREFLGGSLTAELGYEQGLDAFGAEVAPDPLVGPNAQFQLADFGINFFRPWQTGIGQISYSGTLRGQYSEDDLYSNYQFSVGGYSTVRGIATNNNDEDNRGELTSDDPTFDGVGTFSGNSGAYLRNDLIWEPDVPLPPSLGRIQAYAGVDFGISDIPARDYSPTLVGSALGMRLVGGTYSADFSWQQLLRGPEDVTLPDGIFAASIFARF
ncbi:MAG: ShlB/FhaC/HecB family hemolysin secretion/activation protein, partial [Pseudomonadota bacterium]